MLSNVSAVAPGPTVLPVAFQGRRIRFAQQADGGEYRALHSQLVRRAIVLPAAAGKQGEVPFTAHDFLHALASVQRQEAHPSNPAVTIRIMLHKAARRLQGMGAEGIPVAAVLRQLGAGLSSPKADNAVTAGIQQEARLYSMITRIVTPLVDAGLLAPQGWSWEMDTPTGRSDVVAYAGYALTEKGRQYLEAVSA